MLAWAKLQSLKIGVALQPVLSTMKVCNILKTREPKPKIVNEQCMVYHYKCGLCEMDHVGFANRHLYQCINEHTSSSSSIPHETTWGQEINHRGQFFGPQKVPE